MAAFKNSPDNLFMWPISTGYRHSNPQLGHQDLGGGSEGAH